jgi:cation diffusion facilitator CzcD-associated flavoprotein CzcO
MTADVVRTEVSIVGAGMSGLGQAVALVEARTEFLVLEKAQDLGGTWRDNTYPARWAADPGEWTVSTTTGITYVGRFLVLAAGGLHIPYIPDLPGGDAFDGRFWHSSSWNHDVDLDGKRVTLVGVGAVKATAGSRGGLHLCSCYSMLSGEADGGDLLVEAEGFEVEYVAVDDLRGAGAVGAVQIL